MPLSIPADARNDASILSHEEISQCARGLWLAYGQPLGEDEEIWLDAERRMLAALAVDE